MILFLRGACGMARAYITSVLVMLFPIGFSMAHRILSRLPALHDVVLEPRSVTGLQCKFKITIADDLGVQFGLFLELNLCMTVLKFSAVLYPFMLLNWDSMECL